MDCQNCQEREATVVITKIVGEEHTITHLCKACANDLGGAGGVAISIQMLTPESTQTAACQTCGKTFAEFKKSGLFGCADCYVSFAEHLPKLYKRVQGVTRHVTQAALPPAQDDTAALEAALAEAVEREDFEKAAEIRDKLAVLQAEGTGK